MVASIDPEWLQGVFDTLIGMFDRVGLHKNIGRAVGMVFRPFQAVDTHSEAVYKQRMTGDGISYRERHIFRVNCLQCVEEMAVGLLEVHQ